MDTQIVPPERRPKLIIVFVVGVAIYLLSYFPAVSYMVRHSEHQRYSALYRPIPQPIRGLMLRAWLKLDPAGAEITNRAADDHRTEVRDRVGGIRRP